MPSSLLPTSLDVSSLLLTLLLAELLLSYPVSGVLSVLPSLLLVFCLPFLSCVLSFPLTDLIDATYLYYVVVFLLRDPLVSLILVMLFLSCSILCLVVVWSFSSLLRFFLLVLSLSLSLSICLSLSLIASELT